MYLKSLKLAGFKSFADRTLLEFEPGVSVVVGPNGTGKSNIVDAVAWVLGAQFTRALRTDRMDDVIFAGTATRASHSRSEVTVVLDNSDRILPLDLDEVSLTRRLFRGGLSEYEINGVDCRLLDIQDLLSDSGVGRKQHLIVGQGRLESILTARGDQRRRIIEEAAGILKHQVRKAKAIRRLERTDADVLRLHDITGEIKRRKRPLQRQAEAAERHDLIRAELRSLRLWLGGEDLRRLRRRSRELSEEQAGLEATVAAGRSELGQLEETSARMRQESDVKEQALKRDTAAAARLDTVAARLRGIIQVARERAGGLTARIEETEARRLHLAEEAERLSIQIKETADRENRAHGEAEAGEDALRAAEEPMRSIPFRQPLPAETDLVMLRDDLRSLEIAAARDSGEAEHLADRLEADRSRMADELKRAVTVEEELRSSVERLEAARQLCDVTTKVLRSRQAEWEQSERRLRSAEAERIAAVAKAEALAAAAGLPGAPARERLTDSDEIIGALTALLDIPDNLAAAVDTAVGAWAEALVFDGPRGMRRAVGVLKAEGLGGLPLIVPPPALDEPPVDEPPALAVSRRWGVEAVLDRLGPGAERTLATALLGDVVLVEGWSTGWDIVEHEPGIRAVTPEGDLVTSFGVRPADPDAASPGVIKAANRAVEVAETGEARAKQAETDARTGLEAARRKEKSARDELAALDSTRVRAARDLQRLNRTKVSNADGIAGLEMRLEAVRRSAEQREYRLAELRTRIAATNDDGNRGERSRELLAREREAAEQQYAADRRARDNAIRALGAAVERHRMLDGRLARVRTELEGLRDAATKPPELDEARSVKSTARRVLVMVRGKLEELAERREGLRAGITAAGRRLTVTRGRVSEVGGSIEAARERLGELAVEATELRMREESVAEGLRRDADASEERALASERPSTEGEDPAARAASLAAELARMGPINLLATEEFRELDERYRLISDQLSDVETSRAELTKVISALDTEMETLFSRTFEDTTHHYRRFFTVLFPGGTGSLVLTNPDEPLEAAVEIEAQPLGKKIGKLALLSGGERSLAALAFLFAVFKARPGPFYILDEVDAALDDANLHRFLRLVDEFRDHAQLIVVTHQQATVRTADILYGVTMEPGGSSKALVKRMDEVPVLV